MSNKIPSIIMFVLMVAGIVGFVLVFNDNYDLVLYLMYVYMVIGLGLALISAVLSMASNPKGIKGTLIGLGSMLAITGISYALAGNEVLEHWGNVTPTTSKLTDTGLIMFYILFAGSLISIVFSAVKSAIK